MCNCPKALLAQNQTLSDVTFPGLKRRLCKKWEIPCLDWEKRWQLEDWLDEMSTQFWCRWELTLCCPPATLTMILRSNLARTAGVRRLLSDFKQKSTVQTNGNLCITNPWCCSSLAALADYISRSSSLLLTWVWGESEGYVNASQPSKPVSTNVNASQPSKPMGI